MKWEFFIEVGIGMGCCGVDTDSCGMGMCTAQMLWRVGMGT